MAKLLKMTPEILEECKKEFEESLMNGKFSDGRVSFQKDLGKIDRHAFVYFSPVAWAKMHLLIQKMDKEVAWHGLAYRVEDAQDTYVITDILVYPQEVTGATVTTDQVKYQTWLMGHDDETFNNIRFQGHSHVNMGVSPSGVDTSLYDSILEQLDDDMFYIFMIWNKWAEKWIKVYDMKTNVLFETADVTVDIVSEGKGLEQFITEANEMVKNKTFASTTPAAAAAGSEYYNYYYNRTPGSKAYSTGYGYSTPSAYTKKEDEKSLGKSDALAEYYGRKKRKGKRKKESKKSYGGYTDSWWDSDWDD